MTSRLRCKVNPNVLFTIFVHQQLLWRFSCPSPTVFVLFFDGQLNFVLSRPIASNTQSSSPGRLRSLNALSIADLIDTMLKTQIVPECKNWIAFPQMQFIAGLPECLLNGVIISSSVGPTTFSSLSTPHWRLTLVEMDVNGYKCTNIRGFLVSFSKQAVTTSSMIWFHYIFFLPQPLGNGLIAYPKPTGNVSTSKLDRFGAVEAMTPPPYLISWLTI